MMFRIRLTEWFLQKILHVCKKISSRALTATMSDPSIFKNSFILIFNVNYLLFEDFDD
eukprot:UN06248